MENQIEHPSVDIVRKMICHENELTNHRVSWLGVFEGLLFAALAVVWDEAEGVRLAYAFCVIGFLVAMSTWTVLRGSERARKRLNDIGKILDTGDRYSPGVVGDSAKHNKCIKKLLEYSAPWNAFPILFLGVWPCVAYVNWDRSPPLSTDCEIASTPTILTKPISQYDGQQCGFSLFGSLLGPEARPKFCSALPDVGQWRVAESPMKPVSKGCSLPTSEIEGWPSGSAQEKLDTFAKHIRYNDLVMIEARRRMNELAKEGLRENWPNAKHQIEEMFHSMKLDTERRPKREASYNWFFSVAFPPIVEAIKNENKQQFVERFPTFVLRCNICHDLEKVSHFIVDIPNAISNKLNSIPPK